MMPAMALLIASQGAQPASACSLVYPPGYDQKKADIERVMRFENILAIEVLRSSIDMGRPAIVKVTQVLRGGAKRGDVLRLATSPGSACGAGQLLRGQSGWVMLPSLRSDMLPFLGFLTAEQIGAIKQLRR